MSKSTNLAPIDDTEVGSYFVANYPPFSVWTTDMAETAAKTALASRPTEAVLGLYLHIPFCRKRCHFCYFRVYTDRNSSEILSYLDVLGREWELYSQQDAVAGRPLDFVYFGGGTPSFLSVRQLTELVTRLKRVRPWSTAKEITFECEPGTLTEPKLAAIRDLGVTRLSLGIENFNDHLLELNGRAHRSAEIIRSYEFARSIAFPQINVDLIAGMLGETDANWKECIDKTLALAPDSVTIYQMELPFNTTISNDKLQGTGQFAESVTSWAVKRRWVAEAFEAFERNGYKVGSAYTAVKDSRARFVYRDSLWQGADLVGLGVASFGYVNGVHMQNYDSWNAYAEAVQQDRLPLNRAYRPNTLERLIRELVLQLKLGSIRFSYFYEKYGVDVQKQFRSIWVSLQDDGYLTNSNSDAIVLSREGLLRVDGFLPRFFLPEHKNIRYS